MEMDRRESLEEKCRTIVDKLAQIQTLLLSINPNITGVSINLSGCNNSVSQLDNNYNVCSYFTRGKDLELLLEIFTYDLSPSEKEMMIVTYIEGNRKEIYTRVN